MTLIRYSLGEAMRRPGRTLLTLAGVVIGVAAMLSISMTVDSTRRVYGELFSTLAGRADLEITPDGMGGIDVDVIDRIRAIPGITAAVPVIQTTAGLVADGRTTPMTVLGVDPAADSAVRDYSLVAGEMLGKRDGVLLVADFAAQRNLVLGKSVRMIGPTGMIELPIVGLLSMRGAAAVNAGAAAFMPLHTAQRVFNLPGRVNSIALVLSPGVLPAVAQSRVAPMMPPGTSIREPAARGMVAAESMVGAEYGLSTMSIVSLTAGAFVILNSIMMSLSERGKNLAILRALGMTRRQLTNMLLAEAVVLGLVGTALGLLAGWGLAWVFRAMMEQLMLVDLPEPTFNAATLIGPIILGPLCTLLAGFQPARLAARREPIATLKGAPGAAHASRVRGTHLGLAFFALSALFIVLLLTGRLPAEFAKASLAPVMAMMMTGMILSLPPALPGLLRGVSRLTRGFGRIESDMGVRQLRRHPVRTALTVGVLSISIMVCLAVGNTLVNNIRDVGEWGRSISAADYFVRAYMPDPGMTALTALPDSVESDLLKLDGVTDVFKVNFIPGTSAGQPILIMPKSFAADRPLLLDLVEGEPDGVLAGLKRGEVVIGSVLAHRRGLKLGDEIELQTTAGPRRLRVAGIATEYTAGGHIVYLDWAPAVDMFGITGVHVFGVIAKPGASDRAGEALRPYTSEHSYQLESCAAFRKMIDDLMAGVVAAMWTLMALSVVTASLGAVNTLTMNVLEQTRELGVLRAVAMTRGQLKRFILGQGAVLGLTSLVPGLIGGVVFGYLMHLSRYPLLGVQVDYRLEPMLVIGAIVIGPAISILASLIPSRRAARTSIIEALRYE